MAPKRTCECGECPKCKHREYMNAYYRKNPDKMREIVQDSRARRLEKVQAYDRERQKHRDPKKIRAHTAARVLERQPCEVCGNPQSHAHHDDYDKPLDVRWLCSIHHGEVHRVV